MILNKIIYDRVRTRKFFYLNFTLLNNPYFIVSYIGFVNASVHCIFVLLYFYKMPRNHVMHLQITYKYICMYYHIVEFLETGTKISYRYFVFATKILISVVVTLFLSKIIFYS